MYLSNNCAVVKEMKKKIHLPHIKHLKNCSFKIIINPLYLNGSSNRNEKTPRGEIIFVEQLLNSHSTVTIRKMRSI